MPLVVAAAILDDLEQPTRLLAARRSAPKTLAGAWEFPGGKVEPGEQPSAALVRELREELGVTVELGRIVPGPDGERAEDSGVDSDDVGTGSDLTLMTWPIHQGHRMLVWLAVVSEGVPLPLEDHDELRWLDVGDWRSVPWLAADLPIVGALERFLGLPRVREPPVTARVLPLTTLAHGALRLEPLRPDHLPALHRALARPEVFAGGWGGGAAALTPERAADPDAFAAWFLDYVPHRAGPTYVVVRVPDGEPAVALDAVPEVVGTTSYGHVDLACESLHVGWTAYAPSVWGTTVNPACKLMLLEHAFASGFHRVQIQADARNDRSRAAISRLGGTFEGVLRRTNPRADGTWRDTAVYSVLAPEWPAVQAGLRARLVPVDLR